MLPNDDVLSETQRYKKSEGDPDVKDIIILLICMIYIESREKCMPVNLFSL